MSSLNVLVVFYSRYGRTEQLALAAGLGALEERANIRLRRVADAADPREIAADAAWKEQLDRMNMDYVVPRAADPTWADVIIVGSPAEPCTELSRFLESLASTGPLTGKLAAPLAVGQSRAALMPLYAAAAAAGLIVAPAESEAADEVAAARAFGRRVSRLARALKMPAPTNE
jgi:multimeric flavodoxin WrbA